MKISIENSCTGCGLCVSTCPDVFALADNTVNLIADEVPPELEDEAQIAAQECPAEAIHID